MNDHTKMPERGDEVEIRFATQDGYIWHPAIVEHCNRDRMKVRYPSGHPKEIPFDREMYRMRRNGR